MCAWSSRVSSWLARGHLRPREVLLCTLGGLKRIIANEQNKCEVL